MKETKLTPEMRASGITEEMLKHKVEFLGKMRIVFGNDGQMTTIRDGFPQSISWDLETSNAEQGVYELNFRDNGVEFGATIKMDGSQSLTMNYSEPNIPAWELTKVSNEQQAPKPKPISIGTRAPQINVGHWVNPPDYEISFGDGHVYVIEFWATWCGPCLDEMPNLVDLQSRYKKNEVRVLAISSESEDALARLMDRQNSARENPSKGGEQKATLEEIAKVVAVGADPDGTTTGDFMVAANIRAIPTTFVIGKSGLVEYIGMPSGASDVVSMLCADKWDREKFAAKYAGHQRANNEFQEVNELIARQDFTGAIKLADELIELADKRMKETLKLLRKKAINAS